MLPEPERSLTAFSATSTLSSTGSKTDQYDHFSRISSYQSRISNSSPAEIDTERFEKNLKTKHRDACKKMNSGHHHKAIKSFEGILSDLLRLYGEEHERVGSALHNVAVANLRANQLSDARDAIEEAVRIRKTALGDDNPKVGDSLVENGIILLSMKQNEQALKVFQEALCVRENEVVKTRDCNDASVRQDAQLKMAKILHNLGCVNFELGHFDDASESCAKALERQKIVFGSWTSFLQRKSESAKPGFLTMASTLCNRAYIGLEQGDYEMALTLLFESLDIQRELLEADNKLIMTTMQNIGHSYCMQSDFHRAREIYHSLVTLQQESYGSHAQKYWTSSIKGLIYCQIKLFEYQEAFHQLKVFEGIISTKESDVIPSRDLQTTHELMGELNFHLMKKTTFADYTRQMAGKSCGVIPLNVNAFCEYTEQTREAIHVEMWFPPKPSNGSKMTGHRLSYA